VCACVCGCVCACVCVHVMCIYIYIYIYIFLYVIYTFLCALSSPLYCSRTYASNTHVSTGAHTFRFSRRARRWCNLDGCFLVEGEVRLCPFLTRSFLPSVSFSLSLSLSLRTSSLSLCTSSLSLSLWLLSVSLFLSRRADETLGALDGSTRWHDPDDRSPGLSWMVGAHSPA